MNLDKFVEKTAVLLGQGAYGFKPNGMENYASVNESLPSYEAQVLEHFGQLLSESSKDATDKGIVLDLAAGLGKQADYIEQMGFQTVRSDLSFSSVDYNKKLATSPNVVQNTMWRLPFKDKSFVGVHLKDALVHVINKDKLFQELSRVVKPEGIVCILTETNPSKYLNILRTILTGSVFTSVESQHIVQIAQRHRFQLIEQDSWRSEKGEKDWYSPKTRPARTIFYFKRNAI